MSRPVEVVHEHWIKHRRVRVLCRHLADLLPPGGRVLDVGAGDGALARAIMETRPDLHVEGVDRLVRDRTQVPVHPFDGQRLPFADRSFDATLLVDVLHHSDDPLALLREARRVARRAIVVKDHQLTGLFARATLRFMDAVGNRRFGVDLPYAYWSPERWSAALTELELSREAWRERLQLYPWWLEWVFGRRLHFAARLGLVEGAADG